MAGLTIKNLGKKFGEHVVLDDISLELGEDELLVLLGPSGCGKSTVLRLIAGLEEADGGEIYIDSRRVDKLRPRDRNVALVFQNYSLYPHMTVAENLSFPLRVARMPKAEIRSRVARVAELLDLSDRLKSRPGQLSGGQRQRVALGRAIIREPAIFLLDEPLSNLDAELRVRMRQEIVQLQRRLDRPMIHVTHDQSEALTMADRIALLHEGRLLQIGTPEDLYQRPASRFVAEFVGTPRINIVEGRIENGAIVPLGVSVPRLVAAASPHGNPVHVGIRAEDIAVGERGEPARVISTEYLGDHYAVTLEHRTLTLVSTRGPSPPPRPGDTVSIAIDSEKLLFFDPKTGERLKQ
ncbi:MAG: ABC transporter ATP-binding protein [Candidatus Zixiibacteriota bacterium]